MGEWRLKIRVFKQKAAGLAHEFYMAAIIILVGIGAFGLGRLSALESNKPEVRILSASAIRSGEEVVEVSNDENIRDIVVPDLAPGGKVVASKTGTKYHLPWCAGAKSIKEENKIWFDSYQDARAAGYLPASNCKGIE